MVLADGLMIIPEGVTQVAAGQIFSVRLLRWID
jgi:molybdopterin biosynthesis enzyme